MELQVLNRLEADHWLKTCTMQSLRSYTRHSCLQTSKFFSNGVRHSFSSSSSLTHEVLKSVEVQEMAQGKPENHTTA
eukprot:scaffold606856_cov34-Prasinocladus_malaysianus.AAC.1